MINVIFLGQKKLGCDCLKVLHGIPDVNILGVVTKEGFEPVWWKKLYVKDFCTSHSIKFVALHDILNFDNIDFIISAVNPYILSKEIIDKAKVAVNLHTAPLPEYRGCWETMYAIINGEKYFGATLHMLTPTVDLGDIIDKRTFALNENITAGELYKHTCRLALKIFKDNIRNILNNNFKTYPQINFTKSHYYKRDDPPAKEVNKDWTIGKIYRYVRANIFPPFEPAYIKFGNKKIYLTVKGEGND